MTPSDLDQALNTLRNQIAGGPSIVPAVARRIADGEPSQNPVNMSAPLLRRTADNHRQQQRRRLMRITISSAIAACLLAIAGLLWLTRSDRTASAAEALQQTLSTTQGYRGWVRIKVEMQLDGVTSLYDITMNTENGQMGVVSRIGNGWRMLHWYDPSTGMCDLYSDVDEHVLHGEASGVPLTLRFARLFAPMTQSSALELLGYLMSAEHLEVKQTPEAGLVRFDVSSPPNPNSTRIVPLHAELWVDPKSDRVVKLQWNYQKDVTGDTSVSISYGVEPITSIFDLGVPKRAIVVTTKMTPEARELVTKLTHLMQATPKNYVGMVARVNAQTPGDRSLVIWGRAGDSWFVRRYPLPPQWPQAEEVIRALAGKPSNVEFGDAQWAGEGTWNAATNDYRVEKVPARPMGTYNPYERNITHAMYVMERDLLDYGPETTFSVVEDASHPGFKGLVLKTLDTPNSRNTTCTWWLDPKQEFAPAEMVWASDQWPALPPDSGPRAAGIATRPASWRHASRIIVYHQFGKLKDGTPYPTSWTDSGTDYQAQILEDKKLDDAWFKP